eukprot:5912914-Pyramimonas_sp.AAC.1
MPTHQRAELHNWRDWHNLHNGHLSADQRSHAQTRGVPISMRIEPGVPIQIGIRREVHLSMNGSDQRCIDPYSHGWVAPEAYLSPQESDERCNHPLEIRPQMT